MTSTLAVDAIEVDLGGHPGARRLLDWWHAEQARTGATPRRATFDPAQFADLLGAINQIQREADGRLRFRVRGERLISLWSPLSAVQYVDQLEPAAYRDLVTQNYLAAMAGGVPTASRVTIIVDDLRPLIYRRLTLPLLDQVGAADCLLMFNVDSLDPNYRHHAYDVFTALARDAL